MADRSVAEQKFKDLFFKKEESVNRGLLERLFGRNENVRHSANRGLQGQLKKHKVSGKDSILFQRSNILDNVKVAQNLFKKLCKSKKNCQNLMTNIEGKIFKKSSKEKKNHQEKQLKIHSNVETNKIPQDDKTRTGGTFSESNQNKNQKTNQLKENKEDKEDSLGSISRKEAVTSFRLDLSMKF